MNQNLLKSNYKINYNEINHPVTITQYSPRNKSLSNSTRNSILSTKINSSESFLLNSLLKNKSIRKFQFRNHVLRNKIFSSTNNILEKKLYQKNIQPKVPINIPKINFHKIRKDYKNQNVYISPKTFDQRNYKNKIMKKSFSNNNINDIKRVTFIEQNLRDELYDIYNFRYNGLGSSSYNNKLFFNQSTTRRILLKKYISDQEKKYVQDIKNFQEHKEKILDNEKKINNIYKLVSNNELNVFINYNKFLQKKVNEMKEKDIELYKKIEFLKSQIKNLFINIKIESDKLWFLFDIRNFLICVKEKISIKKLPLIFRVYNSNYLDELTKKNENDIYIFEKMEEKKNNTNLFQIPSNLIVYIKSLHELNKTTIDKKFLKYLDANHIIFNTPEEFIDKYILTEKIMLDNCRKSLSQKNYNDSQKIVFEKEIDIMEKEYKLFEEEYNKKKKIYNELKNNNSLYDKKYMKLSSLKDDKKEELVQNYKIKEEQYNDIEKILKSFKNNSFEKNQFLLKLYEIKKSKNFKTEKEYVYYFICKNIIELFRIYPNYFFKQKNFSLDEMNKYINNIKNCNNFPNLIIKSNIIYLLRIYENAISSFLLDYKKNIEISSSKIYEKIKKKEAINKKNLLFKQQRILENNLKKIKLEKYNKKQEKYRYKQRNVIITKSKSLTQFSKLGSYDKKNIIQKDNYFDENNLLSY